MNWENIVSIIRKGTATELKCFTTVSSLDELGPTIVGMANTNGGNIIVGFDAQNYHLIGCDYPEDWFQKAQQHCKPNNITFDVDLVNKNNKNIAVLSIPKQPNQGYAYKSTCYSMSNNTPIVTVFDTTTPPVAEITLVEEKSAPNFQNDTTFEITLPVINLETAQQPQPVQEEQVQVQEPESSLSSPIIENQVILEAPAEQNPIHQTDQQTSKDETTQPTEDSPEQYYPNTYGFEPEPTANNDIGVEAPTAEKNQETNQPTCDIPTPFEGKTPEDMERKEENLVGDQVVLFETDQTEWNKRQQGALRYLNQEKSIQNKKYRELFQVSHKTAHLELIALVKEGLISATGAGRSTCYILAKNAASQSFCTGS